MIASAPDLPEDDGGKEDASGESQTEPAESGPVSARAGDADHGSGESEQDVPGTGGKAIEDEKLVGLVVHGAGLREGGVVHAAAGVVFQELDEAIELVGQGFEAGAGMQFGVVEDIERDAADVRTRNARAGLDSLRADDGAVERLVAEKVRRGQREAKSERRRRNGTVEAVRGVVSI